MSPPVFFFHRRTPLRLIVFSSIIFYPVVVAARGDKCTSEECTEYRWILVLFIAVPWLLIFCSYCYKLAIAPSHKREFEVALKEAQAAVEVKDNDNEDDGYVQHGVSPKSGYYATSLRIGNSGRTNRGVLCMQFVCGRSGGSTLYMILGGGNRIGKKSVIVEGVCNSDGLAWWTEQIEYGTANDLTMGTQLLMQRSMLDQGLYQNTTVRWMTVLTHGRFNFEDGTFQGWFYGQVRESPDFDYDIEERGTYDSFCFVTNV